MRGLGTTGDPDSITIGDATALRIDYKEFVEKVGESPQENYTQELAEAHRIFDVDWYIRTNAAFQILGFARRVQEGGVKVIKRYLPEYHPELPYLVASKITRVRGLGPRTYRDVPVGTQTGSGGGSGSGGLPGLQVDDERDDAVKRVAIYQKARIEVDYEYPTYEVKKDSLTQPYPFLHSEEYRFVTEELHPAAEYLSIPNANGPFGLKWTNDPGPPPVGNPAQDANQVGRFYPVNLGQIVGNIDVKWTWHQVPYEAIDIDTILDTLGRVNYDSITIGGSNRTFEPGSLLLLGVDIQRKNSPYGVRSWNIQYTSRYNPRLHNRFYDHIFGRWCQISKDGVYRAPNTMPPNNQYLFDYRPFRKLFVPNQT